MSRIESQITQHELESLLHEIHYHGFVVLPLRKLYRLLDKWNRAAGTWQALLDAWESIEGDIESLHIVELPHENLLITDREIETVKGWAGHDDE